VTTQPPGPPSKAAVCGKTRSGIIETGAGGIEGYDQPAPGREDRAPAPEGTGAGAPPSMGHRRSEGLSAGAWGKLSAVAADGV
jgi:hypothetical protein